MRRAGCIFSLRPGWFWHVSLAVLLFAGQGLAQGETAQDADAAASPETWRTVEDTPPAPHGLAQLDAVFKSTVSATQTVLFYRLGQSKQSYVLYRPQSIFVRDRGTDGPYHKLNAQDDYPQDELTQEQVQLLAARGKLLKGLVLNGEPVNYRWGKVGDRLVDYIVIKRDEKSSAEVHYGDKFLLEPETGRYRKVGRIRSEPRDLTVTAATVEHWNDDHALVTKESSSSSNPDYLLTESTGGVPVVVAWLAFGSLFFTLYMGFFNVRGFQHALQIVRGKYDKPSDAGEVTHFQALSSALSGTIGLGNIAGVTIAMSIGGPGAFFWMLVSGLVGMSMKFVECTLGVKYRELEPDGTVLGGPMRYLRYGLAERGMTSLGIFLSVTFTIMCILASFGGGNMLQANQAGSAMLQMFQHQDHVAITKIDKQIEDAAQAGDADRLRELQTDRRRATTALTQFEFRFKIIYGLVLAAMVAVVIIGGIRRIGAAAEKIVPSMCLIYVCACIYIILLHLDRVPDMVVLIFQEAASGKALGGGVIGAMVLGIQRAAFSNEAGAGSAPIAHSAARTNEPVREGCVALLEPFIDTVVVCSMTALVILITGAWNNEVWIVDQGLEGSALTSRAFQEEIFWFPMLLSVAVMLFAYSTIISWAYYGERCWAYLFGRRSTVIYKILAVIAVFVGTVVNLGSVLDFSDMMILSMAFPNILGALILGPSVKKDLQHYWTRYRAGEFPMYH